MRNIGIGYFHKALQKGTHETSCMMSKLEPKRVISTMLFPIRKLNLEKRIKISKA